MDEVKAEFQRLVKVMGWTEAEAARKLGKAPSSINHLMNPNHPNKPTEATIRLLKLIVDRERPNEGESQSG
jgi:hypothetical protein